MIRQYWFTGFGIFIAMVLTVPCWAWNDAGHMTIARIAWEQLSETQRAKVVSILRHHPHRESILMKYRPESASESEWIFLRAAVWSDHIRPSRDLTHDQIAVHPIHKFHRSGWHYVNYPYRAGQSESSLPNHMIPPEGSPSNNILDQMTLSAKVSLNETTHDPDRLAGINDGQNRAVRICWLFHLLGDLHQPLHTTTLIDSTRFPHGSHSDHGGNAIAIRTHIGGPPYKLHAFWDDRLGTDSHFPTVVALAEILSRDSHLAPHELPELSQHKDFKSWAAESYRSSKTNVYLEGHLSFALWDDYEDRRIKADDVPILPQGIEAKSNRLARRRAVLAGHRLAQLLKRI